MFYKQRVLAYFWGRKYTAICASRKRSGACYGDVHMRWAINSLFMPTALSFRPQKPAKTVLLWESAREGTRPQVLALMYKSGPPQF